MTGAYYNEFDPSAAAWLRELIAGGHIADGEVDTRSILDVCADDLRGFVQCHFFAGIGGWSLALRLAGWPDDRPVWTGSPPCQPFSAAGRQEGRNDARHLAPHFISLVGAARPAVLFGEQVASSEVFGKAAGGAGKRAGGPPAWAWLDDLSDRLEAARYAVGASDFPSAGVGAPHIRQRTFFGAVRLADADSAGWVSSTHGGIHRGQEGAGSWDGEPERSRADRGLADADGRNTGAERQQRSGEQRQQPQDGGTGGMADCQGRGRREERADDRGRAFGDRPEGFAAGSGAGRGDSGLADTGCQRRQQDARSASGDEEAHGRAGRFKLGPNGHHVAAGHGEVHSASPLHGFWSDADWLFCRDGKWRPVKSRVLGVADGLPDGLGNLRLERNGEDENGTESRAGAAEVLQNVRHADGAPEVQRAPGRQGGLCAPSILRSGLHGAGLRGHDQGDERQEQSSPIGQDAQGRVRDMRTQGASCSSPGREPTEQRPGQPAEPMRFLSQEGTPPEACFPLASGVRHRAALLRGYGNAINPHAAAQFIQAFDTATRHFRLNPLSEKATDREDIFG